MLAEDFRLPKRQETPPRTWVRQKEREKKKETKDERQDVHPWEGAVKEEKFPHSRKPLHWWRWGLARQAGEASEPRRKAQQQRC